MTITFPPPLRRRHGIISHRIPNMLLVFVSFHSPHLSLELFSFSAAGPVVCEWCLRCRRSVGRGVNESDMRRGEAHSFENHKFHFHPSWLDCCWRGYWLDAWHLAIGLCPAWWFTWLRAQSYKWWPKCNMMPVSFDSLCPAADSLQNGSLRWNGEVFVSLVSVCYRQQQDHYTCDLDISSWVVFKGVSFFYLQWWWHHWS